MTTEPRPLPEFVARHIGPRDEDIADMLQVVGRPDLASLVDATLPARLRDPGPLAVEAADGERQVLDELRQIAAQNVLKTSLIGLGYHNTVLPAVIQRNVLENPGWYTAYTPYQPEISQGRLEALLSFQTMIADLTGLDVANSSLLDEATAAAEAMTLMRRATRAAKEAVLVVDEQVFPQSLAVIRSRALPLDIDVLVADLAAVDSVEALTAISLGRPVFGVVVQYPGLDGALQDWRTLAEAVHAQGGLVTAAADLLALTLLAAPGEWGADIAVGTSQRFGVPMAFGGPHAGYLAVREPLARTMPGRLVGVSVDAAGRPAYRLALQTREQHIRREKATSNICTAQVLLAVIAAMYAVYHGPDGLRRIATRVHGHARTAEQALLAAGYELGSSVFFDRLTVRAPGRAAKVLQEAAERGYNLWQVDEDTVAFSFDEATTSADVAAVLGCFGLTEDVDPVSDGPEWPRPLRRTTDFLTADVFNTYHSETQMMRYLRRLADRDYALDRGMIPLGSCTMKLNAATEMQAITWPEFAHIHPFAPADQTRGSRRIVSDLQQWLATITGYDAVTMQPNSGASGELAALMAIRAYHRAQGDEQRDVCLIPASAHGTNAASAAMAGMRVVVIKTAGDGSVDLEDLRAKVDAHRDILAAVMITYPSTHGVYEDTVTELCDLVHAAGGQVYVDGANMNALVGQAKPGHFGGDASHLNLHKTFAIPHGGGGPGVGPVGVRAHLAPYLPNHPLDPTAGPESSPGAAAAAPFGSMGVMPISWAYIRLMGGSGLSKATQVAVLNANYVAARLRECYPVLYSGPGGLVAHECILDLREITKKTGVTVDDVAKRLIDYGFHAPTMSFPVAGTLMVEPTESEDKIELDRFCDAMVSIRQEIEQIANGDVVVADSPLRGAPHTAECVIADWDAPYDRVTAVYPGGQQPTEKYWPPVRRIDGAYGDRHLICSCPAPEDTID
ncbi:glycine dehydrogenase (decarboxylating) alpha subunit /glycine dehydrogenase (decarboxylating) beta subunit [Austwickia chelonae]|uniref:Glycine dehydrogenase (decarboxylating) n=1 Tax=Austwickia chelonae NBRC 105200 TaxID=1184607 RepID=K6VQ09_9MICO|nr:aminomethyl-transferring glycine dehydrogenase [Austwickia chelonae]GAB77460.1 glycine dehydrogenase [Austwickia chelonae NBRC 105200]SEW10906.1 glycine dehydrogenase (decarboxylating) alpha subunit /glycine dehydrogenase (decarboxylating) beta subunit [Austwickia chelonae]